jgi:hypothetical protein
VATAFQGAALLVALAACAGAPMPDAPARADLGREVVRLDGAGPPEGPEGACWARDIAPLVIETVTEQELVSPEQRGPDGSLLAPAGFRTVTQQNIVQDRAEIWFRTPCPEQMTVAFVASLQRALKARGLYRAPVTGTIDAATTEALRRYQAERGLDSGTLALAAAREMGLLAADPETLR